MRAQLRSLWRALFRRRELEEELDEELRFHLEARAADLARQGLSASEAARRARLEFGPRDHYQDECRQARGLLVFDQLRGDLRYAWRSLARRPGATVVAAVILALAIGSNVALFTIVDGYALRRLSIPGADRHVDLLEVDGRGKRSSLWTPAEIAALEHATAPAFEGLYASNAFAMPMLEPARRTVHGQAVSAGYFPLLGARTALGRPFGPEDDHLPVAVLSDSGWRRLLHGDAAVVGRKLRLGRTWFTVVGVTAPAFRGVEPFIPDLWIPLGAHAQLATRPRYDLAGLLRPGLTPEAASGLGSGVVAGLRRDVDPGQSRRLLVERRPSLLHAGERRDLAVVGGLVLGAFALVLLIACANLASLHVARAAARHRELAIRLALGATRPRLVRQLLTESLLLGAIGGLLGWGLARLAGAAIQGRLFALVTGAGLTVAPVETDGRGLLVALFLAVVAGLAFGLPPALEGTSLRRHGGVRGGGRQRLGGLLVTAQVGASLVLLVLASLLLRGVWSASRLDPGYDDARVVAFGFPDPTAATLARLRQDPRVAAATGVAHVPLSASMPRHPMVSDGTTRALAYNEVDEAYFETLGLRLVAGRGFRREERAVVVVSAATAHLLWPGSGAVGRMLEVTAAGGPRPGRYQVIGVAPDVVSGPAFQGRDRSAVYFPAAASQEILVRPRADPGAVVQALRELCQELDPAVTCEPRTLRDGAALWRFPFVVASAVAWALGALAVLLTSIGLYGLVAFSVVQRLPEIGVRLALGATPRQVLGLITGRAARSVALGLALGFLLCLPLSWMAARLFGLSAPLDLPALAGAPLLLTAVALAAALAPARRALGVDPVASLRGE